MSAHERCQVIAQQNDHDVLRCSTAAFVHALNYITASKHAYISRSLLGHAKSPCVKQVAVSSAMLAVHN
jgi:hypothetical protein